MNGACRRVIISLTPLEKIPTQPLPANITFGSNNWRSITTSAIKPSAYPNWRAANTWYATIGMSYHITWTLSLGLRSAIMQAHDDAQKTTLTSLRNFEMTCACLRLSWAQAQLLCLPSTDWWQQYQENLTQADGKFYYYLIYPEFQIFSGTASFDVHNSISDSGLTDFESSLYHLYSSIIHHRADHHIHRVCDSSGCLTCAGSASSAVAAPLPHAPKQVHLLPPSSCPEDLLLRKKAGSSTSSRWYTVTAGRITGCFPGLVNTPSTVFFFWKILTISGTMFIHMSLVVPGACFCTTPLSSFCRGSLCSGTG